jgi:hypothetical protein
MREVRGRRVGAFEWDGNNNELSDSDGDNAPRPLGSSPRPSLWEPGTPLGKGKEERTEKSTPLTPNNRGKGIDRTPPLKSAMTGGGVGYKDRTSEIYFLRNANKNVISFLFFPSSLFTFHLFKAQVRTVSTSFPSLAILFY